jgi:hypothetical protein
MLAMGTPLSDHPLPQGGLRKVFNLCRINRLGLGKWAKSKAAGLRETYFTRPWILA